MTLREKIKEFFNSVDLIKKFVHGGVNEQVTSTLPTLEKLVATTLKKGEKGHRGQIGFTGIQGIQGVKGDPALGTLTSTTLFEKRSGVGSGHLLLQEDVKNFKFLTIKIRNRAPAGDYLFTLDAHDFYSSGQNRGKVAFRIGRYQVFVFTDTRTVPTALGSPKPYVRAVTLQAATHCELVLMKGWR